jgi:FkbM family methyltransferase
MLPSGGTGLLPRALADRLPRGTPVTVVDVGAYEGEFTASVARTCGVRHGVLIEPLPGRAARLRQRFPPPRFQVVECAASDATGRAHLKAQEAEFTSSVLPIRGELHAFSGVPLGTTREIPCALETLDHLLSGTAFGQIDLLKIDVQGYEDRVLRGADETLARTRWVWVEVSFMPLYDGSCTFEDVHRLLGAAGFGLTDLEPGFRSPEGELLQSDALFSRRTDRARS